MSAYSLRINNKPQCEATAGEEKLGGASPRRKSMVPVQTGSAGRRPARPRSPHFNQRGREARKKSLIELFQMNN